MRNDIDARKQEIISRLEQGIPRFEIARWLDCKYDTLVSRLKSWNCSLKNQSRKNRSHVEARRPATDYLGIGKPIIRSHKLKLILIRDGLKGARCEQCKRTKWLGKPLPIELHHVNGDHWDNRLENLRILCPNCHAQKPNNSGKGVKRLGGGTAIHV